MKLRKKLIEVALPLEAINAASAREKSIRHGHPSTLHLWWARRPLAAARAVIFSQIVDDPSEYIDELLTVAENRRRAEEELERRRSEWHKLKKLQEQGSDGARSSGASPGTEPSLRNCAADLERERLFDIIKQLVLWENTTKESVVGATREEIWKSWRRTCADNKNDPRSAELFVADRLPAYHDPFAGGGSLPLEAQRLGLNAYASDLNPVAVLINKGMIEIPPKFAGSAPVNPEARKQKEMAHKQWHGSQGLAEDVRYYGNWMRMEAEKRIGHLYPKVVVTAEMAKDRPDLKSLLGEKLTVIAWLWVRTVKSPNPAFGDVHVPLASTFMLGTKPGKEVYIEPEIEKHSYRFVVKRGKPHDLEKTINGTKATGRGGFRCLVSDVSIPFEYIRAEASAGQMHERLMAVVTEGERGRIYLTPTRDLEASAHEAHPIWSPSNETLGKCRVNIGLYGMSTWDKLFTPRQLVALTTFADLVMEVRELARHDACSVFPSAGPSLDADGVGSTAYADAIATYLGIAVSRYANAASTLCTWNPGEKKEDIRFTFSRQALAMTWDFAEGNPFSDSSGNLADSYETWVYKVLMRLPETTQAGSSRQLDAASQKCSAGRIVSTDPPYYDNIDYADLSDFFYVWLRRALKPIFPDLFSTVAVPKAEELVATPFRHGSKENAEKFFLSGMTQAMHRLAEQAHPAFPVTIYYAFKQSETDSNGESGEASTGWETFLDAVIQAGFSISGTWPIRTERGGRSVGIGANALASSIVLVCRSRLGNLPIATRREFVASLKAELPEAVAHLQRGNIAPVDLAQAAIGPGMAVYTRYAKVVDADGKPLSVRDALALINQTLDEVLAEQEGDFDPDTRWALAWFEQAGFEPGEYGVAEMLSKAKNTSVQGMKDSGILDKKSPGGKVKLLRPNELLSDWDPVGDPRITVWEVVHHLVRRLESGGEIAAADLVSILGGVAEVARELAYRLYTICEKKKRGQEALAYNALVQSWPEIARLAREKRHPVGKQVEIFEQA